MSSNLKVNTILPSTGTAIGIGTASGNVDVLGHIVGHNTPNISGINSVTATTFYGNGANLTGISAGTSLSGSTNNTVTTVTGANAIQGEANLKYADTHLQVGGQSNLGSHSATITLSNRGSSARSAIEIEGNTANCHAALDFRNNGTLVSALNSRGSDRLQFCTGSSGNVKAEVTGDNFKITDGNLIIGTAGHGIDFSASSNAGGMTSELLDDYERGTWTPSINVTATYTSQLGVYVKIGHLVYVEWVLSFNNISGSGYPYLQGLPYHMYSSNTNPVPNIRSQDAQDINLRLRPHTSYGINDRIYVRGYDSSGNAYQPAGVTFWNTGGFNGNMTYMTA